jgi:hypothetical protein
MAKSRRKQEPMPTETAVEEPLFLARTGDVYHATRRYGVSRRTLFRLAQLDPRAVKRFGNRTLWDYAVLDQIVDKLPLAKDAPSVQQLNLMRARAAKARAKLDEMRAEAAKAASA